MLEDKNRKMNSKFNSDGKLVGKQEARLEKLFSEKFPLRPKVHRRLERMILSRTSSRSRIKMCMRLGC